MTETTLETHLPLRARAVATGVLRFSFTERAANLV
jgi:hypothetical protein